MKLQLIASAAALFAATACSDTLTASRSSFAADGARYAANSSANSNANSNNDDAAPCRDGGWQNYTRTDRSAFKNQGDCVSYAVQGGTLVPVVVAQPPVISSFEYMSILTGDCALGTAHVESGMTGVFTGGTGVVTDPLGTTYPATSGVPVLAPLNQGTWTLTVTGPGGAATATADVAAGGGTGGSTGCDPGAIRIPGRKPLFVP